MTDDSKHKIFTPPWFSALLKGQLTTGETFWAGNYGTALFHQPIVALLVVLPIPRLIPAVFWAVLTLYQLVLTAAVIRSKPGVPTPLGWRIAGIVITLAHGALFASLARSILSA
ncbi:MAG: hypothetical protein OQK05_13730 [Pseudopelagicola sp.]|nr:hypothetical protein [Pseudopelagicola sp.]